jgi:hypothetical protein
MDPITLGILFAVGASGAAAAMGLRRRARDASGRPTAGARGAAGGPKGREPATTSGGGGVEGSRVGDVLLYLGDEYWLAGELALVREGTQALRLFSAPERGRERWVALPRDGRSVWVLFVDQDLRSIGWPGVEVPSGERTLRRFEHGNVAIVPSGEVPSGWEGLGRFAVFRAMDAVALVVEGPHKDRLALVGREIPRELIQKLG